jgi:hypothetical protein
LPHDEQCNGSDVKSTQLLLHSAVPAGQLETQLPPEQTSLAWHAWPQLPQFLLSLFASTQPLVHIVKPDEHDASHSPSAQLTAARGTRVHEWPHDPQLSGSETRFRQSDPQRSNDPPQLGAAASGVSLGGGGVMEGGAPVSGEDVEGGDAASAVDAGGGGDERGAPASAVLPMQTRSAEQW